MEFEKLLELKLKIREYILSYSQCSSYSTHRSRSTWTTTPLLPMPWLTEISLADCSGPRNSSVQLKTSTKSKSQPKLRFHLTYRSRPARTMTTLLPMPWLTEISPANCLGPRNSSAQLKTATKAKTSPSTDTSTSSADFSIEFFDQTHLWTGTTKTHRWHRWDRRDRHSIKRLKEPTPKSW
jgi:hypothetical protein